MNQETRTASLDRVTLRAGTGAGTFVGHSAVFNEETFIGYPPFGFREVIDRKAFDRALKEDQDVRLLFNHDPNHVLARTASGTMNLSTDKKGLLVEAELAETTLGKDVKVLLERGDVNQMSFGFVVIKDSWEQLDDGTELRTILDVDLFDTSIVTMPAYVGTDASLRQTVEIARRSNNLAVNRREEMNRRFKALKSPDA